MNLFEFMTESPVLTFFIVLILVQGVVHLVRGRGEDK